MKDEKGTEKWNITDKIRLSAVLGKSNKLRDQLYHCAVDLKLTRSINSNSATKCFCGVY